MDIIYGTEDAQPDKASTMWGTITVTDRGDAPAQVVIEKNLKAQSERRVEETKEQLENITNRVEQAMAAFELDEKMMNDNKAAFFVPDLIELEKIIKDTIQKRKYQQEVTIFIVGYETKTGQRLKLLSQINEFFTAYINSIDEEDLVPKAPVESEMDEIATHVQEALDTASNAAQRLNEIGRDMFTIFDKLHGGKAASKSKKKLEKALMQAKDDIMNLTEKLMGAQTEIEEKEDQMTRLYKQIDMKNLEVAKYKNNAEIAKKNLGQVEDLKGQITEKENEIDKLHRSMADQDLSIQQLEQSREAGMAKLRTANEESEQAIDKLQSKITTLQVQVDESRHDLQRHHESTIASMKLQHNADIDSTKAEYQAKIDKLEEDLQNRVKHWSPDSDEEELEKHSLSRKSSQLDLASHKSNKSKDDKSLAPSRQSSNLSKKLESLSRQSSAATTAAQDSPKPTPDTPKATKRNATKGSTLSSDSPDSKGSTPKKPSRNKSNLEPVHEVPFEEKIPIQEEERWAKVPQEKLPSAFKQYRKEALFIVQGLQSDVKAAKEESQKKLTLHKSQNKEKEGRWEAERIVLIQKVSTVEKLKVQAEKEADEAMAQLENFVKEQGQLAKMTEEASVGKKLKKLTSEQRLKYFGPDKSDVAAETAKDGVPVEVVPAKEPEAVMKPRFFEDTAAQTDPWQPTHPSPTSLETPLGSNPRPFSRDSDRDADIDSDAFSERSLANHFNRVLKELTLSEDEDAATDEERPLSAVSQRSLYEKYQLQLEQKKQEIVERRNQTTSMHGSLLSAESEGRRGAGSRSNVTTPLRDVPFPDEVDKIDSATSPVAFSVSSHTSKLSVESVADHPIVQDYLKAYQFVVDFKHSFIEVLTDRDILEAAERLADFRPMTFDRDVNVQNQVTEMTTDIQQFLNEAAMIINSYLYNDMEPALSSLVTPGNTSKATNQEIAADDKPTVEPEKEPEKEPAWETIIMPDPEIEQLRKDYDNVKFSLEEQKKSYEDKLNNNAVMMMELQDTIQELQHELSTYGGSPAKPYSAMSSRYDGRNNDAIMFSRTDSERNQKALKRAVNAQKLGLPRYREVVQVMDQYTILPAKRLVHLARKYTHHSHMKHIEENVRHSSSLDEEVYTLLERMEALQSVRAQRWGEQMDVLSADRLHLAHVLMDALHRVEEESGIFMIKPILSWKGRGQVPWYAHRSHLSDTNQSLKSFLKKPLTPLRDATPMNMVPAPTPASQPPSKSGLFMRPFTQTPIEPVPPAPPADRTPNADDTPVQGSGIQLVGPQPQPMWAMSSSFTPPANSAAKDRFSLITTPRILELDVNRMLIGQNTVSALTKPFLSNDRLVNASNASVRSYVSIDRPSANPSQTAGRQGARPRSTGGITARPNTTNNDSCPPTPAVSAAKSTNSAGPRHSRTRSEETLSPSLPLPPIRVPPVTTQEDGVMAGDGSRPGTTGSNGSLQPREWSRTVSLPSPPRTPPGSSIRQSPPPQYTPDIGRRDVDDGDDDYTSPTRWQKMSRTSECSPTLGVGT